MTPALLGKKVGMTRIYDEKGAIVPVTVVQAGPCTVTQVKTVETDGYNAVQLGFGEIKPKFSTFPLIGHAAKSGVAPRKHFREIRLKDATDKTAGETVTSPSSTACSTSTSSAPAKARASAGVMKRHHFGGQPARTAPNVSTVRPVRSRRAPRGAVSAVSPRRASAWPVTWAWIRSRPAITRWSRSTPTKTCC